MNTQPFLLDCDTGIDDALAILYLLSEPHVELVAITTTHGNTSPGQAAENTLAVLALAQRPDTPVIAGAEHRLAGDYDGGAPSVHGGNGMGDVAMPPSLSSVAAGYAPEEIVRLAREHGGALNLVCTAPLTNIALALLIEPDLPDLIASVTIMGGAALAPGNISPVAEANIGNDPEAAAAVFDAPWEITLVPLDVTMANLFEQSDRDALLASDRPVAQHVGAMLGRYYDWYSAVFGRPCSALHDPLAAAIATGGAQPSVAPLVRAVVDTTDGPGRGQTICDLRGRYGGYPAQSRARCRVVLEVERPFAPDLLARLLAY